VNRSRLRIGDDDRAIFRLAVPALGALIAEPLYVLADTAIIGHLGTPQLSGFAIATGIVLTGYSVFIFLAYGTTASVGRLIGAGQEREAAHQAIQGIWLASIVGVVLALGLWPVARPLITLFTDDPVVRAQALVYLRISLPGLPAMLITLAGVGYLRGHQDTRRPLWVALATALFNLVLETVLIYCFDYGIGASALSTTLAQWLAAACYLRWIAQAVRGFDVALKPHGATIARLARVGGHLLVRTAALRGAFVLGTAVASHLGPTDVAAHQITFNMWMLLALTLDAVAIAGQSIVARHLGAGDAAAARASAVRMVEWSIAVGVLLGIVVLATRGIIPAVFTDDHAVRDLTRFLLLFLALLQPLSGVAFALDGILIGAGDQRYLAYAMTVALLVFVPLAIAVDVTDAGIGWLWGANIAFMTVRCWGMQRRFATNAWAVTGAVRV
jgi:putative MATE family efflux protein